MYGLAVAGLILLYALFWVGIVSISKPRWLKIAAVVAAVAIPFWDWPVGYLSYQYHCATEGGVRILKDFGPQDRIFLDGMPVYSANELLKMGFKVVEMQRFDGRGIARHESGAGEAVITKAVDHPESRVKVSIVHQPVGMNVFREDSVAVDQIENVVLARYSAFSWGGGWIRDLIFSVSKVYARCSAGRHNPIVRLVLQGV